MQIRQRSPRKSWLILTLVLVVLSAGGIAAAALMLGTEQITATAALTDACEDAEPLTGYDATSLTIEKGGRVSSRMLTEADADQGMRMRFYHIGNDGEELTLERRVIFQTSTPPPTESSGGQSTGREASAKDVKPIEGEWLYLDFMTESPGDPSAWTQTSYSYTYSEMDAMAEADEFCGVPIERLEGVRRVGPTTLNGISVIHYAGNVENDGDPSVIGEDDEHWDFWVTPDGRPVRYRFQNRFHGYARQTTYSNWNIRNTITAPRDSRYVVDYTDGYAHTGTHGHTPTDADADADSLSKSLAHTAARRQLHAVAGGQRIRVRRVDQRLRFGTPVGPLRALLHLPPRRGVRGYHRPGVAHGPIPVSAAGQRQKRDHPAQERRLPGLQLPDQD